MDKETLIRLAQPAAKALLAISITTLPLVVQASDILAVTVYSYGTPVQVKIVD